jgi:prepilin-type N-terminal cleavage/methylation domain-containing protein
VKLYRFRQSERGFTLVEVMTTIIIMGILAAIALSVWWPIVEGRRVDSATNEVVSELRRAHTSATTRLEDWRVEMDVDTRDYRIYRIDPDTGDVILLSSHRLPERTEFHPDMDVSAIVFEPNGEADITTTGTETITVAADDGSPCHEIEVNTVTSRVEVSTNAC